jgi:lysophospholipase L1-like esterase
LLYKTAIVSIIPSHMKSLLVLSILSLTLFTPVRADFLVQANDVVGIAGDSITQQHLYSAMMEDYLLMCQPTAGQKVVNFGWSGEVAPVFLARLQSDVYPFKPTVMTTCYGMNDGYDGPINDAIVNQFTTAQTAIVESLKKNGVRTIVLGSSKCVDTYFYHIPRHNPNLAVVYNKTLGALADIDKQIAQKEGVVYCDVFGTTLDVMKKIKAKFGEDYCFAGGDGVHPGPNGQLVMAYSFLKSLGCDGNIGIITIDMGSNTATGTHGHEIVSDTAGLVTVKSTRYPFCFSGTLDDKSENTTAAVTTVFPFNDDLNRYMLIVKGLTAAKAKVTWGGRTKEYSADQLGKGINLAAEFLDNPFVQPFNAVNNAVRAQEEQETMLYQQLLHNMDGWKANLAPGVDSVWQQVVEAGFRQHDKLYQAAQALVVPVTHTIKIEPEP